MACKLCHGVLGNGNGHLAKRMEPSPRNFTCGKVMEGLPDGQLFLGYPKWFEWNGHAGSQIFFKQKADMATHFIYTKIFRNLAAIYSLVKSSN